MRNVVGDEQKSDVNSDIQGGAQATLYIWNSVNQNKTG